MLSKYLPGDTAKFLASPGSYGIAFKANLIVHKHGRRQRGQGGCDPLWIFLYNTDKAEGGLMVLFFGLVFPVAPWKFFCRRPYT